MKKKPVAKWRVPLLAVEKALLDIAKSRTLSPKETAALNSVRTKLYGRRGKPRPPQGKPKRSTSGVKDKVYPKVVYKTPFRGVVSGGLPGLGKGS